jgi:hypothetical protein
MLLSLTGDSSSTDFDMIDFGNSDEPTHSYQDVDMNSKTNGWKPTS